MTSNEQQSRETMTARTAEFTGHGVRRSHEEENRRQQEQTYPRGHVVVDMLARYRPDEATESSREGLREGRTICNPRGLIDVLGARARASASAHTDRARDRAPSATLDLRRVENVGVDVRRVPILSGIARKEDHGTSGWKSRIAANPVIG